jgi:hypothetical protein
MAAMAHFLYFSLCLSSCLNHILSFITPNTRLL